MEHYKNDSTINRIYGIAYQCPLENRIEICPLAKLEKLAFKEKVKWINNLGEKEMRKIEDFHSECSRNRISPR